MASIETDIKQSTCTICLEAIEDMGKASFLPCFHGFHQPCFDDYISDKIQMKRDITCPVCRKVHFTYGDRNYSYIVGQLGCATNTQSANLCNNFIFEAPRSPTRRRVDIPSTDMSNTLNTSNTSHTSVTINIPTLPTARDEAKIDTQMLWYRYRYYVVFVVIICVLVFVLCMIVKTSSIST
jgi:hypothetical protein